MSSKSVEELTIEVQKLTRAVLLSKIGGVTLPQFEKDYRALVGKRFPYKDLGFSDTRSCLESLTDTVRFEYSDMQEELLLFGIADAHVYMSSPALKAQFTPDKPINNKGKRTKNKKSWSKKSSDSDDSASRHSARNPKTLPKRGNRPANEASHLTNSQVDDINELKPNMQGLYTLCVVKLPVDLEINIQELFSEVASPEECSRGGAHFFLRYTSRSEAEDVISRFNNYTLNGLTLKVQPAKEKMGGREGTQPHAPKPKESISRDSVESRQAQEQYREASCLGSRTQTSGYGPPHRTDQRDRKTQKSNELKNPGQVSQQGRGQGNAKRQLPKDKVTPRLPRQQPLPNGDAFEINEQGDTESCHDDGTLHKFESIAAGRLAEPVDSLMQTGSVSAVCNRVIPKPGRRSIADLAYRFKGTNIEQSVAGPDSKTC